MIRLLQVSFFILICISGLQADHIEATNGDLSDDRLAPTPIALVDGSNIVSATSISGDVEYFSISIPAGGTLESIDLTQFSSGNVAFLAFQEGLTFSDSPGIPELLGWSHLGLPLGEKLNELAASTASGAIGFDIPLPAGDYTFWAQETASSPSSYTLDFVVRLAPSATVPTMSQWSLIILGLLLVIVGVVAGQRSLALSVR